VHRRGDDEAVLMAGALESGSTHPVARAVTTYAAQLGTVPALGAHDAVRGSGVVGRVDGRTVHVGRPEWVGLDAEWDADLATWRSAGLTVVAVSVDQVLRAMLAVGDEVRATSRAAITDLRRLGLEPVMVTGDAEPVARAVAADVGITRVVADARPEDKVDEVARLRAAGRTVAVIGDGINDAAALAGADLGIAMGGGTDVAIEAAGVTLLGGDLRGLVRALVLSRRVMRNIRQNLFFAFVYNLLGVPLAAGALYPLLGLLLNPMIAAAAMSLSSVSVIANALRLRGQAVEG
jgi:Cu+-exporting ATPase